MLIVISPSKNMDENPGRLVNPVCKIEFDREAKYLNSLIKKLNVTEISELMSISQKLAELTLQRNATFSPPFTTENAIQAIFLFSGDVYQGLQASSLTDDDLRYAQAHMRIFSGLYGLIRPLDLIQAYRLEMGIPLENKAGKNLYPFWKAKITKAIQREIRTSDHKILVNLASKEYFSAIDLAALKIDCITPHFREFRNGKLMFLSFNAKKARGLMTRFIIQNRLTATEDLKLFNLEGYFFDKQNSSETELVFAR